MGLSMVAGGGADGAPPAAYGKARTGNGAGPGTVRPRDYLAAFGTAPSVVMRSWISSLTIGT
jgi:hypothetical protein